MIKKKYNLLYLLYFTLIVGYNFDPLNLSSDPWIFVCQVHCTHLKNFQNESLI